MRKIFLIVMASLLLLAGCSNLRFPGVYRIDIPQGNFVTDEMLSQLQPGMTEEQVRYVLGAPTLRDPFTPDTWFYLMTYEPGKGEKISQEIVVHFSGGSYSHYEGEVIGDMKRKVGATSDKELHDKAEQRRRDNEEKAALPAEEAAASPVSTESQQEQPAASTPASTAESAEE